MSPARRSRAQPNRPNYSYSCGGRNCSQDHHHTAYLGHRNNSVSSHAIGRIDAEQRAYYAERRRQVVYQRVRVSFGGQTRFKRHPNNLESILVGHAGESQAHTHNINVSKQDGCAHHTEMGWTLDWTSLECRIFTAPEAERQCRLMFPWSILTFTSDSHSRYVREPKGRVNVS